MSEYTSSCPQLPTVIKQPRRIIAIGDIHGDRDVVINSLILANIIKKSDDKLDSDKNTVILGDDSTRYKWIGGDTVVVQIGDQNDGCRPGKDGSCNHIKDDKPDDIPIFEFFNKLHRLAQKSITPGAVYSLLGNHEIMNAQGNFKYTSNANINQFGDEEGAKKAFAPGNKYANLLGCTRQSVLIVGDFLFVHANLIPELLNDLGIKSNAYTENRNKLKSLNKLVRNWLLNIVEKGKEFLTSKIIDDNKYSPFWNRILGQLPSYLDINDQQCQDNLQPILEAFAIKGMVIGHTPQMNPGEHNNGVNSTCGTYKGKNYIDQRLFRIDVGASKAFIGHREPEILEILRNSDGTYKYSAIMANSTKSSEDKDNEGNIVKVGGKYTLEHYDAYVPDDITSFSRLEAKLPYREMMKSRKRY